MLDLFTETKKVSEKEEVILEQQLSMAVQVLSEIVIVTPSYLIGRYYRFR